MRIYVASSWRNEHVESVIQTLRGAGHDVYDFRQTGFQWSRVPGYEGGPVTLGSWRSYWQAKWPRAASC